MMLFAETGDVSAWWVGVAALVTATGAVAVNLFMSWTKNRSEEHKDAIGEWKEIADEQQKEIDGLRKDMRENQIQHSRELREMQVSEGRCRVEVAQLRGEIRLMESTIRRLQHLTGDDLPITVMPGLIVANAKGIIQVASPAITPILHYLPGELRGKSVEILIPERHRKMHREALAKTASSTTGPWPERVILSEAVTKEGEEILVAISLYGWKTAGGDWQISAEIRLRRNEFGS